ncbi:uncharacterized protein LOC113558876 isoform X2 [Rhopalosiphum maidis]|uniref:uncharacterized protein LOC113558876 isoform X2 n=1 Tax=Rhopalosiphum maidis TaxID=43146 RepID=UPI000EFE5FE3|nr:uncharacterized protein LOC113558876 isoform X2 [Rhopalosiphum maidis]
MKTSISITIILIVCLKCLNIVMGSPLHQPLHRDEHYMNRMQQFCGQHLTQELEILCGGDYNDVNDSAHPMQKRITEECCSRQCSRNYIKMNYCSPLAEEKIYTDSPDLNPIKEVDYLGYYFELRNWTYIGAYGGEHQYTN